jgi:hypothetical protein
MAVAVNAPRWLPGKSPYAEYLHKLTPEQKAEHLKERANRRTMKKAFEIVVSNYQAEWIAKINKAMLAVIDRAIETGDPACLVAVADRIIGKPVDTINTETNLVLPWNADEPIVPSDDDEDEPK